jgi:toxin YoeB
MRLIFSDSAWQDYLWFQDRDRKLLKRINALIKDITRTPFKGIGKPEGLKANLSAMYLLLLKYLEKLPGATRADDEGRNQCVYSPHSLRATTATLLLDAGVDIRKVQDLLGGIVT